MGKREEETKLRLLHMTTIPETLDFLHGNLGYMKDQGFEVHVLSSAGDNLERFASLEDVIPHNVNMKRRISPLSDCKALFSLCLELRLIRPHILHAHTPKAGLLGMIGAWLMRVPIRIYHIHGQPLLTAKGFKRFALVWSERVSCLLAHRVLCVSHSIAGVTVMKRLCAASKIKVLLKGSIGGIDSSGRFNARNMAKNIRNTVRADYKIPDTALVIGYVGRIVKDKGLTELVESWGQLKEEFTSLHMLVVGAFEPQDPIPVWVRETLMNDSRIYLTGRQLDMPKFYTAMDIFVLPTYREGFPVTPLEAAAMELPVVATKVPGCIDSLEDGMTGTIVEPYDSLALVQAIRAYLKDARLRRAHGKAGRERVIKDYQPYAIWAAIYGEYVEVLQRKGFSIPESHSVDLRTTIA